MSLLLDALKKAGDKKKENESLSSEANVSENTSDDNELDLTAESDDLDLDLEIEEDFPLVEEDVVVVDESVPETEQPTEDLQEDEALLIVNEEQNVDESETGDNFTEKESEVIKEEKVVESTPENIDENIITKAPEAKVKKTFERKDNEEALSALINKSNYYTKDNRKKSIIAITFLLLLFLVIASVYYYIELTSSTQDLFLADNKAPELLERKIVKQQEIAAKNIQSEKEKQIVMPVIEKPVPKRAKITKTKKSKPVTKKTISIIHKTIKNPIDDLIHQAYDAFITEDYKKSKTLYSQVLNQEGKNRDALLGLAAIAVKEQRYEYARQQYLNLLKLDPKDSFARAGLSSIDKSNSNLKESQLKFMIRDQPDAAHLYFALGSHYATQEKWAEAQSSFFSAWSADNKNADYCYNLAVSLDHLGKKYKAKDFYTLSINLKKLSGGNFSKEDADNRIKYIQDSDK